MQSSCPAAMSMSQVQVQSPVGSVIVPQPRKGEAVVQPDEGLQFSDADDCSSDSGIDHLLD